VAHLYFTPNLARQVDCPADEIDAETVRELFDGYFAKRPAVRGYVLDDQGVVRRHIKVVVDDGYLQDRQAQSDAVYPTSRVYVFQLLSGG